VRCIKIVIMCISFLIAWAACVMNTFMEIRNGKESGRVVRRVALLMEASRSYERGILRGIASYAQLHGNWQFHRRIPYVSGGGAATLEQVRAWKPDGLIIREGPELATWLGLGLPAVVAPFSEPIAGVCNVRVDDAAVGRMAAEHFLASGFRHLAFCGLDHLFFFSRDRRDSFVSSAAAAGVTAFIYRPNMNGEHLDWSRDLPAMANWLAELPKPLALLACNDDFGLVVLEACKHAGLRVPEDVALMGVGNDEAVCDLTDVPISSIRLNTERAGHDCAERLDRMMGIGYNDDAGPVSAQPVEVVQRLSSDLLAVGDRAVATAIRYIREHASQPLHVNDVVQAAPMSRRTLYDRFRQATGYSVYDYIRRVRLEAFTRMLLDTNLGIAEISYRLGFPDEKNVARYFSKSKGMTPLAYRRQHGLPTSG